MKKVALFTILLLTIGSCKMMVKEIKKTVKVRNAALLKCECDEVSVESDYGNRGASLEMTVEGSTSEDKLQTALDIMAIVQDSFPKICNYDQVYIVFEEEEMDERFTFYGCEPDPKIDTLFYGLQGDTIPNEETEDEWDTFMDED